jgi:Glycosyltransferase family 87
MWRLLATLSNQSLVWMAGITLVAAACAAASVRVIPSDKLVPDFNCYWTAGTIVTMGESPYDVALQTQIQRQLGWDRARDGFGRYDFAPYYYPPWFAMAFALLVPLGFETARIVFYLLNVELLFLSAYLLSRTAARVPPAIPLVVVPLFVFCPASLLIGQTAILVLFLTALAWKLLERGNDRAAGAALAFLTTKPQLGAVLVLSLLLWAARQRRWRVAQGFALTLGALALASAMIMPLWPLEMMNASAVTPPPTAYVPWIGTTWLLALRTVGLQSWGLWSGYLALAVPFLALVVRTALDRSRPVSEVIALGILAAFVVAPYGRHYDFPVLLIPLFVLMGGRLPELAGAALMVALLVLPYLHLGTMMEFRRKYPGSQEFPECTFLWVPALLTGAWLIYEVRASERRSPANAAH